MTIQKFVAAAALVGLTACGGGGDSGIGSGFGALDQQYDTLFNNTPVGSSVGTGVVNYSGVMLVATSLVPTSASPDGYLGTATMSMDFDNSTFTGSADGFYYVSIDNTSGNANGILTSGGAGSDGSVVSSNVEFNDGVTSGSSFDPTFSGTIDGKVLGGIGAGTTRGTNGNFVVITQGSGFTVDGLDADVTILGN